jgi:hypothetical protein
MNASQTAARQAYDARVAELRAAGKRLGEAHEIAHREAFDREVAAWRAQDPERR